jgi:hypothetical protein
MSNVQQQMLSFQRSEVHLPSIAESLEGFQQNIANLVRNATGRSTDLSNQAVWAFLGLPCRQPREFPLTGTSCAPRPGCAKTHAQRDKRRASQWQQCPAAPEETSLNNAPKTDCTITS